MTDFVDIGALDDIPMRGARVLKTAAGCVAVFRTHDDAVFALDNECPHKGGPLSEGIVHGHAVTCPLHNWVIGFEDGAVKDPDEGQVATYPAKVEGGRVLVDAALMVKRSAA